MSFEDLPESWPTIPLTDPDHIANVLDLFVGLEARQTGALVLLICDEERRPLQPIQIDHISPRPPTDALSIYGRIAETIGSRPGLGVLCAMARPRRLRVTADDQAWRRLLDAAFDGHAEVLGFHVVTLSGSIPVPAHRDAA